jgi:hypothetical protein
MYGNSLFGGGVAGAATGLTAAAATQGTLPFTGLGLVWFAIGAFALLMAAGALWRIAPRSVA